MNEVAGPFRVHPIGFVASELLDPSAAPLQGDEGAPPAWLVMDVAVRGALAGLGPGDRVTILTWLHLARRDVLATHPRGDRSQAELGVFSIRSQDRPNPIGIHVATIVAIDDLRVRVDQIEAIDGTPILDIKPTL